MRYAYYLRLSAICYLFLQHPTEYLGGWRNQVCARVGAMVGLYSPVKALPQVRCSCPFALGTLLEAFRFAYAVCSFGSLALS